MSDRLANPIHRPPIQATQPMDPGTTHKIAKRISIGCTSFPQAGCVQLRKSRSLTLFHGINWFTASKRKEKKKKPLNRETSDETSSTTYLPYKQRIKI